MHQISMPAAAAGGPVMYPVPVPVPVMAVPITVAGEAPPGVTDAARQRVWSVWRDRWRMVNGAPALQGPPKCVEPFVRNASALAAHSTAAGLPDALKVNEGLYLMELTVEPDYAHPRNRRGGHLGFRAADGVAWYQWWIVSSALLDGSFGDAHRVVTGTSLVRKPQRRCSLKLWLAEATPQEVGRHRQTLLQLLHISAATVRYSPHRCILRMTEQKQQADRTDTESTASGASSQQSKSQGHNNNGNKWKPAAAQDHSALLPHAFLTYQFVPSPAPAPAPTTQEGYYHHPAYAAQQYYEHMQHHQQIEQAVQAQAQQQLQAMQQQQHAQQYPTAFVHDPYQAYGAYEESEPATDTADSELSQVASDKSGCCRFVLPTAFAPLRQIIRCVDDGFHPQQTDENATEADGEDYQEEGANTEGAEEPFEEDTSDNQVTAGVSDESLSLPWHRSFSEASYTEPVEETDGKEHRRATAIALHQRALAHLANGEASQAVELCSDALTHDPSNSVALCTRAAGLRALGDIAGCVRDCDSALYLQPNDAHALRERASAKGDQGDWKGCLVDCDAALRIEPGNAFALYHRAAARRRFGDYAGCVGDCTAALETQPENPFALRERALALCELGEFDRSMADCDAVLRIVPNEAGAVQTKARAEALRSATPKPGPAAASEGGEAVQPKQQRKKEKASQAGPREPQRGTTAPSDAQSKHPNKFSGRIRGLFSKEASP